MSREAKKKQDVHLSSGLHDHYSELFTRMAALKFENAVNKPLQQYRLLNYRPSMFQLISQSWNKSAHLFLRTSQSKIFDARFRDYSQTRLIVSSTFMLRRIFITKLGSICSITVLLQPFKVDPFTAKYFNKISFFSNFYFHRTP